MTLDTIKLPRNDPADDLWPPEVDIILSAMDAAQAQGQYDRRYRHRMPYRVRAQMRLYSDQPGTAPWTLYTRDVDAKGLGFITSHRLPLGYGGILALFAPSGRKVEIPSTLFRCRQAAEGWYEGALYFNREQPAFDVEG